VGVTEVEHKLDSGYTIADLPVWGYIDVYHVPADGGPVVIRDWKTTGNERYIKTAAQVADTVQMGLYGHYAATKNLNSSSFLLEHVYLLTKGTAKVIPRSRLVDREFLENHHKRLDKTARVMLSVVNAKPDEIQPTVSSCFVYGRCAFADKCSAFAGKKTNERDSIVSILQSIRDAQAKTLKTDSVQATTPEPAFALAPPKVVLPLPGVNASLVGANAELAARELEANKKTLLKALATLKEKTRGGVPQLIGDAARLYCLAVGIAPRDATEGQERLVDTKLSTLDQVIQAAHEVTEAVEEITAKVNEVLDAHVAPVPEEGKRGRGRPPKSADAPKIERVQRTSEPVTIAYNSEDFKSVKPRVERLTYTTTILVNCSQTVGGRTLEIPSLSEYLTPVLKAMSASAKLEDIRLASSDHPYGYGKWKAFLQVAITTAPPAGVVYQCDTRDEIVAVALGVLKQMAGICVLEGRA
jgi:PD-(D/E)XK nuclease superfamily